MNFIIETIGKNGVKTTPSQIRMTSPKPGDVIDFGEGDRPYPYTNKRYGRIDSIDGDRVHFCCQTQGVFLADDGSVSISGGPFVHCDIKDLEPTRTLRNTNFWNWGDNCAGASQGVYYTIARPVFTLSQQFLSQ